MKTRLNTFLPALALSAIFVANSSHAADLTWDATTNTTWNTTAANWTGAATAFTNGDTVIFSSASTKGTLTLGGSVNPANLRSNGTNTPATINITGAAGFTLSLGSGSTGSGNIAAADGVSGFEQNLNYNMTGAGSAFALTPGSGTSLTPSIWNVASGKSFTLSAGTTGQVVDLNGNTLNLNGAGTVRLNSGATLTSTGSAGVININAGTLHFSGGSNRATTVNNSVTVNVGPTGTLQLSVNTGAGSNFSQNTNLSGGTLTTTGGTAITVGGTVTLATSTTSALAFSTGASTTVNALAGAGEANLVSGNFSLTATYPSFTGNLKVSGGSTASLAAGASVNHSLTLARSATSRATLSLGASSIWAGNITVDNTATQTSGNQFAQIQAGGADAATASVISGNVGFSTLGSVSQPALVLRSGGGSVGRITGSVSLSNGTVQLLDASRWQFSNTSNTWGALDINNNNAIVHVGAANALSSTGVVTASNVSGGIGTLKLNNLEGSFAYNQTIAGLSGAVRVGLDTGTATLTLNTTTDQSASGVISGAISLVKSGSAKQTLTGVNTYTGSTTINGGTLALGATGTISSGDLNIASATLDLRKGANTRIQTVNNLSLNNATFEVGMNAMPDRIDALGVISASGTNTFKLYGSLPAGTYDLMTSTGSLTGSFVLDTSGVTSSGFPVSYSGSISGGNYVLTVSGAATPFMAYWHGDVSSVWTDAAAAPDSNWASDSSGIFDAGQIVGAITDVYFSTATATNTDTTLGANLSINSLTFESGSASVGGANSLTILTTSAPGISVLSGATATLNTSSIVSTASCVVQAGGALTVNGGGLGAGALRVDGVLNLNMNATQSTLSGSGIIARTISGNSILTVSGASNESFSGAINDAAGTMALVKGGASTLTLSGSSSYSAGTIISGGVIRANSSNSLGSGTIAINGGQRLSLGEGVTVANPISIGANSSPQGAGILEGSSSITTSAALTGPINITNNAAGGGHFINASGGIFDVKGVITATVPVVQRNGIVTYWGGGTGYNAMTVTGTARLGANNGLATSATVTLGGAAAGILDLAGYHQSLAGVLKNVSNAATIGNSSTTASSVLTITGTSSFDGVIRDTIGSGTRTVGLVVNGGTLTLGGINTFTGNTIISSGALVLQDNAQLKFAIGATSGTSNSLTGVTATLNGDFNIDTTLADSSPLTSGTWVLENVASLTGGYGTTFQVVSGTITWTATGDVWTKTVGTKTYSFDETTGVLTLTGGGFDSWIASKGLTGPDAAFDADPDNDGVDNGLEFVLGGEPNPANPGANSVSLLPTVSQSAGTMVFSFKRKDIAESGITLTFQWSTDLTFPSPANDVPVGAVDSTTDTITVDVTEDNPDSDTDSITITIPAAKAVGGKLFGRLKATPNP